LAAQLEQSQQALESEHSEAFYRSLVESLPQSVLLKDLEGRFTFANRKSCELIGKPLQEIVGKTDFDLFPSDLAAKHLEDDHKVLHRRETLETVEEHFTARGEKLYLQSIKTPIYTAGKISGVQCVSWDVTGYQAGLEALRESEERFRHLFEEAPVACHEIDTDGIVRRVNRAECALLGFEYSEIIGRPVWNFVAGDERIRSQEAVRKKLSGEQPLVVFSRDYFRRDGTRLTLEIHEKLIHDASGAAVGTRSSLLDITERVQAQQKLARQAQELARSNAELEQFAYVASHDLQEPLRKVQAFGDRLKTKCADALGEQGLDYLARMQNAAGRMQLLINDLLTLSRIRTKPQPLTRVNLNAVARAVVSDLETRIEQLGANVEIGELPTLRADALQISQLLQNLIGNALKFHRPGEPPVVKVTSTVTQAEKRFCVLVVEDNGIGFQEKYLDKIFQVFQRLHGRNEYEGTGIGLAVCRQIAERHGGNITASSEPGKGAKFSVTLASED
jgi:PAS domain S-box-containing protein